MMPRHGEVDNKRTFQNQQCGGSTCQDRSSPSWHFVLFCFVFPKEMMSYFQILFAMTWFNKIVTYQCSLLYSRILFLNHCISAARNCTLSCWTIFWGNLSLRCQIPSQERTALILRITLLVIERICWIYLWMCTVFCLPESLLSLGMFSVYRSLCFLTRVRQNPRLGDSKFLEVGLNNNIFNKNMRIFMTFLIIKSIIYWY